MKHAIMIMAHKNFEFLHHLIEYFSRDCYVFVHIDKKSTISREEEACLLQMPQVSGVYRKYSVHWGGFSILKCELFLMKEALRSCNADYFHLISGQDYPIKPLSYFLQFFEERQGYEFLNYVHLPHPKWGNNTYSRFQYYYLFEFFSNKHDARRISSRFVKWQKLFKIKRNAPFVFEHIYGNSQWFSITRDACKKIIDYTVHHNYLYKRYKWTFAPEESYISTVLLNLLPHRQVMSFNLRYINWKYENGNSPANLDNRHLMPILKGYYLFARKFDLCSQSLLKLIDQTLLRESDVKILPSGAWDYDGFLYYTFDSSFKNALVSFCKHAKIKKLIDVGCGSGIYVAEMRKQGFDAIGIDGNPHTIELSNCLTQPEESYCYIEDITKITGTYPQAELIVCKDILPYIPIERINHAINNICNMANKYILLNLDISIDNGSMIIDHVRYYFQFIKKVLSQKHFCLAEFETNYINNRTKTMYNPYYIFKKHETKKFIVSGKDYSNCNTIE